jgi:nucleoside-diphosphate-sugar epimerase
MRRAADLLDWRPRVSLAEGMAHTERWLKSLSA